jgi:hypothetical protein
MILKRTAPYLIFFLTLGSVSMAAEGEVKYKGAKDLSFEELLIEGQLKRPEMGVITGDEDQTGNGLLRLRENFNDRMTAEAGKEAL